MLIVSSISGGTAAGDNDALVIGLVNNMPDGALCATERQFCDLLSAASEKFPTRLRLFSLTGVPRAAEAQAHIRQYYENISELWTCPVDGVIITGTEPRAASLTDEPYWPALTEFTDWAEDCRVSCVWSCLAAHAAVLYADGICRRPMAEKLSGVFECVKAADHPIVAGAPSGWRVPHSRHNDLPEEALISNGYRIISHSPEVGADIFIKERGSLSIFLQGHPEYDADTLFREYRRDVRRFLANERESYPKIPWGYFDDRTAAAFAAFEERAKRDRYSDPPLAFPQVEEKFACAWRGHAVRLYRNWLSYLAEQRRRHAHAKFACSSVGSARLR